MTKRVSFLLLFSILSFNAFGQAEQGVLRTDSKTGKFSLDVPLYNNLKEDPFQPFLICRQTDFRYQKKDDGSFEEVILFETANLWVLMGLTQTPDNPKGAEVTYYPALAYSDPSVDKHKVKPNKVDTSVQLIVTPLIEENPQRPGHALNTDEYKVVMKLRKELDAFKASDGRAIEKQIIEKSIEIKNPVGHGRMGEVEVGPEGKKITLEDPAPTTYNTRNIFTPFDLFFSPDLDLLYSDAEKSQKILCKI